MKKFYSRFVGKKLLIVLLSFICVGRLWADTYIPAETINGDSVWTKTNSPYILQGTVTVMGKLTIEPGVTVQFPSQEVLTKFSSGGRGISLDIQGTLIAQGTASDSITFQGTGEAPGSGGGPYYVIRGYVSIIGLDPSILQYVTVKDFGYGDNHLTEETAAINIGSSSTTITNCSISNTRGTGIVFPYRSNTSSPAVSNNKLTGNYVGLKFDDVSPLIDSNHFLGNIDANNIALDVITDPDNLYKMTGNDAAHIGLTANNPMSLNDTLISYNYDYRLINTLTVPSTKTFTIKPGVTVYFPSQEVLTRFINGGRGIYMDIEGKLIAQGTSDSHILFQGTGEGPGTGGGPYYVMRGYVYIGSAFGKSVLQYVTVSDFGFGNNHINDSTAAIDINSYSCTVSNCIIQNTRGTGLLFRNSDGTSPAVFNNQFINDTVGIKFESTSPLVDSNHFSGNPRLDVITEPDNLYKMVGNDPAKIGLTANLTISRDDTLINYNIFYRLLNTLALPINRTLTMEPGITVQFPSQEVLTKFNNGGRGIYLDINGKLIAKGTPDSSITFQGIDEAPGSGGGPYYVIRGYVSVESSSNNSLLQYITVQDFGYGDNHLTDATAALSVSSSTTIVANCIFQGVRGTGITVENASPYIAGSCFIDNRGGVYSSGGQAKIYHSNFTSNSSFGLKNISTSDTVNAANCYWNSPLGPTNANTNPVGGDVVSDYVIYTPWAEDFFDCSDSTIDSLLPLTLLNFQAFLSNNAVTCNWQTANEINTSYFIVQRSTDGVSFTSLGKVYASGNSTTNKSYSFTDKTPNNVINYYRLQMVDKDGRYSYSKTQPINIAIKLPFAIYPNPVKDVLYVQVQRSMAEKVSLQIVDMQGKIVSQQSLQLAAGITTLSVNTNALNKGSYFAVIKGQTTEKKLFIKE